MKNCLECGSQKIIKNARVFDRSQNGKHNFEVYIDEDPNALVFKKQNISQHQSGNLR